MDKNTYFDEQTSLTYDIAEISNELRHLNQRREALMTRMRVKLARLAILHSGAEWGETEAQFLGNGQ